MDEKAKIVEIASDYNYWNMNIWRAFHVATTGFLDFKDFQDVKVKKDDIIFIWESPITKDVIFQGWLKSDGTIKKWYKSGHTITDVLSEKVKEWAEWKNKNYFDYRPDHYYKY